MKNQSCRDKNGRFVKSVEKRIEDIGKKLDSKEGRQDLAKDMIAAIEAKSFKPQTVKSIKANGKIHPDLSPKQKFRDTQRPETEVIVEAIEKDKKARKERESASIKTLNFKETEHLLNEVASLAAQQNREFFDNEMFYGLQANLRRYGCDKEMAKFVKARNEIEDSIKGMEGYAELENEVSDELTEEISNIKKKIYKRIKRQHGKKFAKILFYNAQTRVGPTFSVNLPKTKAINKRQKELDKIKEDFEKEREQNTIECPGVSGQDMSTSGKTAAEAFKNIEIPNGSAIELNMDDCTELHR